MLFKERSTDSRAVLRHTPGMSEVAEPRRGRRAAKVIVGVSLIVAVLLTLDWWQLNREMDSLLKATTASEQAMENGSDALAAVFRTAPRGYMTDEQRSGLRTRIQDAAGEAAADTEDTGAAVEEVSALPWHRSLIRARTRYLDHSDAWQAFFAAVATDPAKLQDRASTARISATFRVAHRAYLDAVPPVALNNARPRVDRIFAD